MKTLLAVVAVIFGIMVSCKSTDKNSLGPQGSFEVQSVKRDSVADKGMTLNFNAENGQINGKGVCNSYSSTYVVSGNNIKFSPSMSTKMMCPEGTTLEYNFFQALLKASSYNLKRGRLTLFDTNEEVLLTASEN